jgi:hypothetical protein
MAWLGLLITPVLYAQSQGAQLDLIPPTAATITWATPAVITYMARALSSTQLDVRATVNGNSIGGLSIDPQPVFQSHVAAPLLARV